MLESLRLFANNWLAKFFLCIVLLCFAFIWATPLYKGTSSSAVLETGHSSVSENEFIFQLYKYLSNLTKESGSKHPISVQEAVNLGAMDYFNKQLNFNSLMNGLAQNLNLNLSGKKVAEILSKDKFFAYNNNFNVDYFKNYIHQLGIPQSEAIQIYKKEGQRKQLLDSFTAEQKLPQIFFDKAKDYFNEQYDVQYLTITKNNLLPILARPESTLQKWYNDHKKDYVTDELRNIQIFTISKNELIKNQTISDDEIKKYYDKNISKYTDEERRDYEILKYNSNDEAVKGLEKPDDTFKNNKSVEVHRNATASMLSDSLKKVIFALKPNEYSKVIKDQNKFYIAKLLKITPKKAKALEEVKQSIKDILAKEKAEKYLSKSKEEIDSKLKTKTSFSDIAKNYKLSLEQHVLNPKGESKAGVNHNAAIDEAAWSKLERAVFHAEKGQEHIPIILQEGGYVWYNLVDITPKRQKSFAEVKEQIAKTFLEKDTEIALDKRAQELKQELDDGMSIDQLAKENNLTVEQASGINRLKTKENYEKLFTSDTISNILSSKLHENIVGLAPDANKRVVCTIDRIYNDPAKATALNSLTIKQLNEELKNDLLFNVELIANDKNPLIIHRGKINYLLSRMR